MNELEIKKTMELLGYTAKEAKNNKWGYTYHELSKPSDYIKYWFSSLKNELESYRAADPDPAVTIEQIADDYNLSPADPKKTFIMIMPKEFEDSTYNAAAYLDDLQDAAALLSLVNDALMADTVTHSSGLQPRYQLFKTAFTIDFCNGLKNEIEVDSLEIALQEAAKNMAYTQCDTKILNVDGETVALSKWYGVQPSEDDTPLETFGMYGFYDSWTDPENGEYI